MILAFNDPTKMRSLIERLQAFLTGYKVRYGTRKHYKLVAAREFMEEADKAFRIGDQLVAFGHISRTIGYVLGADLATDEQLVAALQEPEQEFRPTADVDE